MQDRHDRTVVEYDFRRRRSNARDLGYAHGAIWWTFVFAMLGQGGRAAELFAMIARPVSPPGRKDLVTGASSRSTATRNYLLLALAFAAGYIDALSYLGLSRVFTANMTGNTVLLGIAVAELDGDAAVRSGLALAGFLIGVAAGAWIVERDDSQGLWPRAVTLALGLEWLILVVFAVGWQLASDTLPAATPTAILILLSALAMGVQSAAVHRLEVTGISTTYITGTLTNLVAPLMGRARRKRRPVLKHSALLASLWIVYLGGAVTAAVDLQLAPALALALPVVLIAVVIAVSALAFRTR